MPSVGSSLAIVVGAASTCFVRVLRSIRIACFKSLYPWWVVSQLLGQSAPLESECLEEKVEVLPRIETMDGEVTVKAKEENGLVAVEDHPGLADQGRNGVRVSFLWYQSYLDSEATRTTWTMKRGLTIRRIVYWSCPLSQVAALRRHMREEEIGLVALSCHFALDVMFLSMD